MKRNATAVVLTIPGAVAAQSDIDPVSKLSWQENCGWMNRRDASGAAQGIRDRATFLSGSIWCENIGWINLDLATAGQLVKRICYANCDQSTILPALNVQDFACFLNAFAAGNAYANCDRSTTPPALNVQDFSCFLNRFATGCP